MTLPARDDVLDEAYERLFRYGPEFDGWLSNHGPMVVEVLERNHCPDAISAWLDRYASRPFTSTAAMTTMSCAPT